MNTLISFEEFYNSVWLKVPEVWRNADDEAGRALQLLVYTMSQHMYYYFYKKAAHLDELFDPDLCPAPYLKFLASCVGWSLVGSDEKSWREQIKCAPLLYKVKGTKRGLALAERLVGYSVFMSELYRDHLGDFVPKERIFNSIPAEVERKPWFKTVSRDEYGNPIPGQIESDLFDSFNEGEAHLNLVGEVIRPAKSVLRKTASRVLSTTSTYDIKSGVGSLARYAKAPRINVVLKRVEQLDWVDPSTGRVATPNVDAALDLLLRFKPFHVYINNIDVLFDISDYVFGYVLDPTAGTGVDSAECINFRENFDFSVYIDTVGDKNETISYRNAATSADKAPSIWVSSKYYGQFVADYRKYSFSESKVCSDFAYLQRLGFSPKGAIEDKGTKFGYCIVDGKVLSRSDFLINPADSLLGGTPDYVDTDTREILYSSLKVKPTFTFRSFDLSSLFMSGGLVDVKSTLTARLGLLNQKSFEQSNGKIVLTSRPAPPVFVSNAVLGNKPVRDTVTISSNGILTALSVDNNVPWNLRNFVALDSNLGRNKTLKSYVASVFENFMTFIVEAGGYVIALDRSHYRLNKHTLVINTLEIAKSLGGMITSDDFLINATLYVAFFTRETTDEDFGTAETSRSATLRRGHGKYTRQYDVASVALPTSDHIKSVQQYVFNDSTGQLDPDAAHTKVYKKELPRVFSRNSLMSQSAAGDLPVVVKDILNVCDKRRWKVYSRLYTSYYAESERTSRLWWTDFYQVDEGLSTNGYLVNYLDVDTSYDSHERNRTSSRWQTALKSLDTSNPDHFLATRRASPNRNSIWTRGSAAKMPYPYKGDSRGSYQGNRSGKVLFTRDENLSDYATQITVPSKISNYKYVASDSGKDISRSYFNPMFSEVDNATPRVENFTPSKVRINQLSESLLTYDFTNTTNYDNSTAFVNRKPYYADLTAGALDTSLYAGNMVTRRYPNLSGLIFDGLDKIDIMVDGLKPVSESFEVVRNTKGETQTAFRLKYSDIFVSWYKKNTGEYLGSGLYPAYEPDTAIPDVKVYINGIQVLYGDKWDMNLDTAKSILIPSAQEHDVIRVDYMVLSLATSPQGPQMDQEVKHIKVDITSDVVNSLLDGTLLRVKLPTMALVSWYDTITGKYISTNGAHSELSPGANYATAVPDVKVRLNGAELKYVASWRFIMNSAGDAYVQIEQAKSYSLAIGDVITVHYEVEKIN